MAWKGLYPDTETPGENPLALRYPRSPVPMVIVVIPSDVVRGTNENETRTLRHPNLVWVPRIRIILSIIVILDMFIGGIMSFFNIFALGFIIAIYQICLSVVLVSLEAGAIVRPMCGTDGGMCKFFNLFMHFDYWKRGLFYILLSIPTFFDFIGSFFMNKSAGVLLILLGIMYCVKDMEFYPEGESGPSPDTVRARPHPPEPLSASTISSPSRAAPARPSRPSPFSDASPPPPPPRHSNPFGSPGPSSPPPVPERPPSYNTATGDGKNPFEPKW